MTQCVEPRVIERRFAVEIWVLTNSDIRHGSAVLGAYSTRELGKQAAQLHYGGTDTLSWSDDEFSSQSGSWNWYDVDRVILDVQPAPE